MKNTVRQSDVRRVSLPIAGLCCVCGDNDTHHFMDASLGGPVCNDCVAPLLNAEAVMSPRKPIKFHAQKPQ